MCLLPKPAKPLYTFESCNYSPNRLKPLPVVREKDGEMFDEVTDPEFRYRQRYADLIVNPHVKEVFVKRTKLMNAIRNFLNEKGALGG